MIKYIKIIIFMLIDAIIFNLSYILSFLIRYEFNPSNSAFIEHFPSYIDNVIALTLIKLVIFFAFGIYYKLWKYADSEEMIKVILASISASAAAIVFLTLLHQDPVMPRSIYIISFLIDSVLIVSYRFAIRYRFSRSKKGFINGLVDIFSSKNNKGKERYGPERIMLIGAGIAGASIIREIKTTPSNNKIVVIVIDDDTQKKGKNFMGSKIVGSRKDINLMARRHKIDEIIIAIPSASKKQIQGLVNECNKTKCKVRILPYQMELTDEDMSIQALRDVGVEDLLGREEVKLNIKEISRYLEGKIVMVTGGGGTIGSELCRQIANYKPRKLISLDIYENSMFELAGELGVSNPELEFETVIGSVRNMQRMNQVFNKYKPHVIFHVAAHKHIPLMEMNPGEAVFNNIIGTKNMAELADVYAAEKFLLISTDKAVNPTNVMGATKRIAEMIVQEKGRNSHTEYSIVRFGNVLGSNGSVIPVFTKQIERGGPVTVTDKDISRYFLTTIEAVKLIIQSGAISEGGEIFILDMGEPIKILDLAESIVKLSGLKPYEDIDIVITELRPGEVLHEEISYEKEFLRKTRHEKIFLGTASTPSASLAEALKNGGEILDKIVEKHVEGQSDEDIKDWLHVILPSYKIEKEQPVTRGVIIEDD